MAVDSKKKGATYELAVTKLFTQALGKEFRRVPLSGSLDYLKGDIYIPKDSAWFPWTIECKFYKELNFTNLLHSKSNPIYSFWEQAQGEAAEMEKKPLVVFRFNRSKNYVIYNEDLPIHYQEISSEFGKFRISLLDDFLAYCKKTLC